jgi:diguanylate cyclase (GGDEF)-like protein/PAS domain S-box-containing protein
VLFPAPTSHPAQIIRSLPTAQFYTSPRMSGALVLLVDSHPEDVQLIREELALIRGEPFRLQHVTTLAAALHELKETRPDVILLDPDLTDSLGLTTFLRLQPKAGDQPIILLVGQADEEIGMEAVDRGALDYLIKQQLVSTILGKALRYATERTHTLLALKASESRYRELFENVVAGVFQTTPDGKFMAANPALVKLLGYDSEEDLLELSIAQDVYLYPEERGAWMRFMEQAGEVRNGEVSLKRRDGRKIVVLENSRGVRDEHGNVIYYEGTLTDITEAHEHSRQLSHEASHDALTGLVNRREFETRLQRALDSVQATGANHAVCYLDLDRFKVINDTCGHVAGDELLRQLAQTLQGQVRNNDSLARLGGDEFGVLLHDCPIVDATRIAESLRHVIEKHQFVWGTNSFSVGASIGLVPLNGNFRRIVEVLQAADAACYAAKDHGRNRVRVYEEDDDLVARRHGEMQWVARVRRALKEDRVFLEGQPLVAVASLDATPGHYEVLMRMRDESGRIVPPGAFLPAVERYNLAARLDQWVIGQTLQWLAADAQRAQKIERIFINLCADTVGEIATHDAIAATLDENATLATKIGFELTETAAIGNLTRANRLIDELRQRGCIFALDDFGSGISSFAYLKALKVDFLKIDRLFIGNIAQDPIDYEMVRSITEIGHAMGKRIVAEAVEDRRTLEKLQKIGVDFAQGFVFGVPVPLDEVGAER